MSFRLRRRRELWSPWKVGKLLGTSMWVPLRLCWGGALDPLGEGPLFRTCCLRPGEGSRGQGKDASALLRDPERAP